jgi:hypothetical protein
LRVAQSSPRSPLTYLLAASLVAVVSVVVGLLSTRSPEPTPISHPSALAKLRAARAKTETPAASVPRLARDTEGPLGSAHNGRLWYGLNGQTAVERDRLAALTHGARETAGKELGLTSHEAATVEQILRVSDSRWAQMEADLASRAEDSSWTGAIDKLRASSAAELDQLGRALGQQRAHAFRQVERRAYRQSWQHEQTDQNLSVPARAFAQRRLMFLGWPPVRPTSAAAGHVPQQ